MPAAKTVPTLEIHEVDADRWHDFERLFEAKGSPKYCWCMAWRATSEEAKRASNAGRKNAMAARIKAGTPVGLLGYIEGEPAAWCSIAPRDTYRRLVSDGSSDEGIWSVACFFVRRQFRGEGITKKMLAAALDYAREHGARIVESYPVDEDSPSYRFMGFVPLFEEAGFEETGREGTRRHVMQRKLRSKRHG